MYKSIFKLFDRFEQKLRGKLSHHPVLYALIGGIGVILFWRGVWYVADVVNVGGITSLIVGIVILLLTGVLVYQFIGSRLIITGLAGEQKLAEKEELEIKTEESELKSLQSTLSRVEKKLDHLESEVEGKN